MGHRVGVRGRAEVRRRLETAPFLERHEAGPFANDDVVEELDADTRQEEIARMLSGNIVTAEARAAAASLIAGARP